MFNISAHIKPRQQCIPHGCPRYSFIVGIEIKHPPRKTTSRTAKNILFQVDVQMSLPRIFVATGAWNVIAAPSGWWQWHTDERKDVLHVYQAHAASFLGGGNSAAPAILLCGGLLQGIFTDAFCCSRNFRVASKFVGNPGQRFRVKSLQVTESFAAVLRNRTGLP